jgi:hypothetical protein
MNAAVRARRLSSTYHPISRAVIYARRWRMRAGAASGALDKRRRPCH